MYVMSYSRGKTILSSISGTNLLSVDSTCGVTYPDQNSSTALVTIKIDMEAPPSYTLGFLSVIRVNSFEIVRPILHNRRTGLAKGQVAGIVVGILSFLAIVIFGFYYRKRCAKPVSDIVRATSDAFMSLGCLLAITLPPPDAMLAATPNNQPHLGTLHLTLDPYRPNNPIPTNIQSSQQYVDASHARCYFQSLSDRDYSFRPSCKIGIYVSILILLPCPSSTRASSKRL